MRLVHTTARIAASLVPRLLSLESHSLHKMPSSWTARQRGHDGVLDIRPLPGVLFSHAVGEVVEEPLGHCRRRVQVEDRRPQELQTIPQLELQQQAQGSPKQICKTKRRQTSARDTPPKATDLEKIAE